MPRVCFMRHDDASVSAPEWASGRTPRRRAVAGTRSRECCALTQPCRCVQVGWCHVRNHPGSVRERHSHIIHSFDFRVTFMTLGGKLLGEFDFARAAALCSKNHNKISVIHRTSSGNVFSHKCSFKSQTSPTTAVKRRTDNTVDPARQVNQTHISFRCSRAPTFALAQYFTSLF